MTREFLAAVDAAVEQALPEGWPRVRAEKLPAHGSQRARHAFRLQDHTGPAAYLVIAVAPPFISRSAPSVRSDLEALIDHVLSRGASLLLLYDAQDDPDSWLRNGISCPHPRFLCLACTHGLGDACTTEPTHAGNEPLADTIRDLWSGELFYRGPTDGPQTVGVEILQDTCWRCHADIDTVTGIVFPDRQIDDWTSPHWTYFRQILELAAIPDILIPHLAAAIETWRAQPAIGSQSTPPTNSSLANLAATGPNANLVTNGALADLSPSGPSAGTSLAGLSPDGSLAAIGRHASDDDGVSSALDLLPDDDLPIGQDGDDDALSTSALTPIRWRHSKTAGHAYWAAECPSCTAFRGAFPIMERRLTLMHDLEARRTGELRYLPLVLDIPRDALRALMWGFECTAHARPLGWYRADILDPADPPDHPDPRHIPTRHLPLRPPLAPLNPLAPRNTSNPHLPPGTAHPHQAPDPLRAAQSHLTPDPPPATNAPPPLSRERPQSPDAATPQGAPDSPPYDVDTLSAHSIESISDARSSASPPQATDTDDDKRTTSATVTRLAVSRVLCHADPQGNLHPLAVRSSHLERPRNAPSVSRLEAPPPPPPGPLRRLGHALFGRHLPWARK